ncbi:MAG: diguanylate cyclase [Bacillota bacterium]
MRLKKKKYIILLLFLLIIYLTEPINQTKDIINNNMIFKSNQLFFREDNNFGHSSYYGTEKIKYFIINSSKIYLFFIIVLIILALLISYYKENTKLKISKIKYEKLFKKSPVGLILCDIKGNIIKVNKKMAELLGAPDKDAVRDLNINEVAKVKDIWNNKFLSTSSKEIEEKELEYITNWGKDVYLKYYVKVILSENSTTQIIIAANDISKEKKIERKLEYLSFQDELTGLYNRRYFDYKIKKLDCSRNLPISIIIGDLDNLKYINDNFGHKKGDEYIIKAAKIFENNCRDEDIAARIGGDEFAIILPTTNYREAQSFCQRIHEKFEKSNSDKEAVKLLSISLGFEVMENSSQSLNNIFNKADQKMYLNKGRK